MADILEAGAMADTTVSFTLTAQYFDRLAARQGEIHAGRRASVVAVYLLYQAACIALALLLDILFTKHERLWTVFLPIFATLNIIGFFIWGGPRRITKKVVRAFRRPSRIPVPAPVQEVSAGPDHITARIHYAGGAILQVMMNWAYFDDFEFESDAMWGFHSGDLVLCVPARAVRNAQEWETFCREIRRFWGEAHAAGDHQEPQEEPVVINTRPSPGDT